MPDQAHDLVLYGATSFVGQITARHLLGRHGVDGDLSWAIAGRSPGKLETLRDGLGEGAEKLPIVIADATDEDALQSMVDDTRVVISCVGPYATYGSLLVQLCAASGTDYGDLTGEVQWVDRMIREHSEAAAASGARIVHCCGYDSIPSDLGVLHLQRVAQERFGAPATRVRMRVKAARGGASGGTIASLINVAEEAGSDPEVRRAVGNPYVLLPEDDRPSVRQPDVTIPQREDEFDGAWAGPFVMAGVNTRVVLRSNHLLHNAYGDDFRYDEGVLTGKGPKGAAIAAGVAGGTGALVAGALFGPTRKLLEKVLPEPGEGPSNEAQEKGFYVHLLHGTTAKGEVVRTKVTGDRDPGYGSTAKLLGEAGACLAQDVADRTPAADGGFWTPASLLGDDLLTRLQEHAGLTFEVLD